LPEPPRPVVPLPGLPVPTSPATPVERPVRVGIEIEANYTVGETGSQQNKYVVERWSFVRAASVTTKVRAAASELTCPNCSAPWRDDGSGTQKCSYCHEVVENGRFDWQVESIVLAGQEDRPPALTGSAPERGTDLPTVLDPGFTAAWAKHPDSTQTTVLVARLNTIYSVLNTAWSNGDLRPARSVCSDSIYDYLNYWVTAYKSQNLRNTLEGMRITQHKLVKLTRDKSFDALTIRIFATGKDFVVDLASNDVVGGSDRSERRYSEYWTLIRSAQRPTPSMANRDPNQTADQTTQNALHCPNCGADVDITMAGDCNYCKAHVTAGEFDWVLSKIEQDDSYSG
jgi:hypothetical protein